MAELQNTIKIDGTTYDITAKTAEVADKVNNSLVIKKTNLDGTEASASLADFNGEKAETVTVVPASGGMFTGRVNIENYPNQTMDSKAILNSSDIKKFIVNELKSNSVLYTWNGTALNGGGESASVQSISIITGAYSDVDALAEYIWAKKPIAAYIYICSDSANRGKIYFGTSASDRVAGVEVSAENALTAVNATNAEKITSTTDATKYYTYDNIAKLDTSINGNSSGTEAGILKILDAQVATINNELKPTVTNNTSEINKIKNGTTTVPKATQAASADIASRAADNKVIHYNYYRIDSTDSTNGTTAKVITISNAAPSGGNNGDIWIKN